MQLRSGSKLLHEVAGVAIEKVRHWSRLGRDPIRQRSCSLITLFKGESTGRLTAPCVLVGSVRAKRFQVSNFKFQLFASGKVGQML